MMASSRRIRQTRKICYHRELLDREGVRANSLAEMGLPFWRRIAFFSQSRRWLPLTLLATP